MEQNVNTHGQQSQSVLERPGFQQHHIHHHSVFTLSFGGHRNFVDESSSDSSIDEASTDNLSYYNTNHNVHPSAKYESELKLPVLSTLFDLNSSNDTAL